MAATMYTVLSATFICFDFLILAFDCLNSTAYRCCVRLAFHFTNTEVGMAACIIHRRHVNLVTLIFDLVTIVENWWILRPLTEDRCNIPHFGSSSALFWRFYCVIVRNILYITDERVTD